MCVLFICSIFVLILSVGRTTDSKNVPLKVKLTQSLTHLNDMLANIEDKIEHERKMLSKIKDDLNHKQHPVAGRTDYPAATSVWWNSEDPKAPAFRMSKTTEPTTTQCPLIQDLKKNMIEDNHDYLVVSLTKFMELLVMKNTSKTLPVIEHMRTTAQKQLDDEIFTEDLVTILEPFVEMLNTMTLINLQDRALWMYFILKHKDTFWQIPDRYKLDFYSKRFTEEDGEKLFEALQHFNKYPDVCALDKWATLAETTDCHQLRSLHTPLAHLGGKDAAEVSDLLFQAAVSKGLKKNASTA